MSPSLISPWKEFLHELDSLLDEPFFLHCIGGFAVVMGYGLPRSTNDIDYRSLNPYNRITDLQVIAGPGSALAKKHKIHSQYVAVDSMPENYDDRLTELFAGHFKNLRLFVPDPYDLILSKLSRNHGRDRDDVKFLAKTLQLDSTILRDRYTSDLRPIILGPPETHDSTLNLWIDAYFSDHN
jgi:Nucleotidyltransferase of unknown function (DUF6036)